ncbi:hypothetical protein AN911_00655 [Mycobacteroides immunogenum]|uniref:C2H2-type domain-containing protein n=1 Tax=Mycobacteroides immunogenum TaxID=83262 RepID=A0A7V8LQW0_9MYCO|nr:hypothetical protein AN909_05790 [Mycobacteroides immunogenum]KPG14255.1 hypothetical protein AN908_06605 [Mycobacteroides immunogenum]KPG14332.1 hypothetical protein AN908_07125 [Mycobacteroides immunogenum]KPG17467.1 hypothetical protein AN910_05015 [Mycobacteroides immunogenum]KPG23948.1 hypothetical protein AN911_00140 [Mycobacteroides immunogenum]
MSEARKLMAEVLSEHRVAYLDQFICTGCKESFENVGEATAHQSTEIDKALGGLEREMAGRLGVTDHGRWVSGWTEETE